jgi:hypothetical protein
MVRLGWYLAKKWLPIGPVALDDVVAACRMLEAKTERSVLQTWRDVGIVVGEGQDEKMNLREAHRFFFCHCLFFCSDPTTSRPKCGCEVYCDEAQRRRILGFLQMFAPDRLRLLRAPTPLGSGGRSGRPRRGQCLGDRYSTQEAAVAAEEVQGAVARRTKRQREIHEVEMLESPSQASKHLRAAVQVPMDCHAVPAGAGMAADEGCWLLGPSSDVRIVSHIAL